MGSSNFERDLLDALVLQEPFSPVLNLAAPGANTAILASDVTPAVTEIWGITVSLAVGSVLNLTFDDGTGIQKVALNDEVALGIARVHTFLFAVAAGVAYNFEVETDGIIRQLIGTRGRTGAGQ